MENPYDPPTSQPQSRESIRLLWKRRLVCPHCGRPDISVGRAMFRWSMSMKINCPGCGGRSNLALSGSAWWKNWFGPVVPIGVSLLLIAFLRMFNPFVLVDEALFNWSGGSWVAFGRTFGRVAQGILVFAIFIVVALTPILLLHLFTMRVGLRTIAFHSTRLPVADDKPPTAREKPSQVEKV